jgi:hypothetical protein
VATREAPRPTGTMLLAMSSRPAAPLPDWLADQLPFARTLVDVGGYRMHVMSAGDGPVVLLLHGNPTWGYLWRKVVAALGDQPLRLVMPDLVGLGLSDKPRQAAEHTLESHAGWLERLVDALGADRPADVGQPSRAPGRSGAHQHRGRAAA